MKEKHHNRKTIIKSILAAVLLLASVLSYAQNEGTADSVVLVPSLDSVPIITPEETETTIIDKEEEGEEDDSDDKKKEHFLPIGMPGSGLDSFNLRKADDRLLRGDEDFWYANTEFKKKEEEKKSYKNSTWYQTLLWVLIIGGFIAFLIIYLANSNVTLFRKSRRISEAESNVETDDIFIINYQKEIDKAVAAGNYRLAVRLLFLRQLRGLSDRNIIQYTQDRTNFDYLLQVYHAPWYQHFFRLTRNYEYVWYGQFDIDNEKYDIINKDFHSFERQLPPI